MIKFVAPSGVEPFTSRFVKNHLKWHPCVPENERKDSPHSLQRATGVLPRL